MGAPTATKEKGPPVADGLLTETPDTPEAIEWRSRQSVIDAIASSSTYLDDENDGVCRLLGILFLSVELRPF